MAWYQWDQSNAVFSTNNVLYSSYPTKNSTQNSVTCFWANSITLSGSEISLVDANTETLTHGDGGRVLTDAYVQFAGENTVYYCEGRYRAFGVGISGGGLNASIFPLNDSGPTYTVQVAAAKGDFVQKVYSTDPDAYPADGVEGLYWYSGKTVLLPIAPGGISVPTVVAGQPAAISWTDAAASHGSISSYVLERSVNGSGWTQIFSGNALTHTDTVGEAWATVAYRVYAVDDGGGASPYTASQTQVVNSGVLYISGPAPTLGQQVEPFEFTVSTGVSGDSEAVSVLLAISLDGDALYSNTVNTGQTVSVTIDPRIIYDGNHVITVNASADGYIAAIETYTFSTPGFELPAGGLGMQLQDNQGISIFPQSLATLIAGLNGKSVAGNLRYLQKNIAPRQGLLKNAFFADPVNQRGQTSYSGVGAYCIDMWYRGYSDDAILTLQDGYIEMVGADNAELLQRLEGLYLGEELTASVLLQDGTLFSATATMPSEYTGGYLGTDLLENIPNTNGVQINLSYYENCLRFIFICPAGSNLKVVAAKLERGGNQTLAFMNDFGVWQLFEIPNYSTVLQECQYYAENIPIYFTISNGSFLELFVPYKVEKRIAPTVMVSPVSTVGDTGEAECFDGEGWTAFPVEVASYTNGFRIYSNAVPIQNAIVQFKAFASADL